jgi:streptomycin 6-kinase
MQTFEKNIINSFGEPGKKWIDSLPSIIEKTSKQWQLQDVNPVEQKMNWNYVALAMQNNNYPVVLKLSYDRKLIQDEYNALKHFNGNGAVRVIDINLEYNALLLEQAIPGYLLKEHHPLRIQDTINIYAAVVKKLSTCSLADNNYAHAKEWCDAIDKIHDPRIPNNLIEKAKQLRSELLNTAPHEYLCHGDLHLENIIQHGADWIAIDPKGIIGEMAFEAAAFDLITSDEMRDTSTIPSKIIDRVTQLANALDIPYDRLLFWIFLRIIISAQWFIEDNGDPSQMITLVKYVYALLEKKSIF